MIKINKMATVFFTVVLATSLFSGFVTAEVEGGEKTQNKIEAGSSSKNIETLAPKEITSCSSTQVVNTDGRKVIIKRNIKPGADPCIEIAASNVTLLGQGYSVVGGGSGTGITANGQSGRLQNITIKNIFVEDFNTGINLQNVTDFLIRGTTVKDNQNGISGLNVKDGRIDDSEAKNNNGIGMGFGGAYKVTVYDNDVISNEQGGIQFYIGDFNRISSNEIRDNEGTGVLINNCFFLCTKAENNFINGNTIINNSNNGIELRGANRTDIIANTIRQAGNASIKFDFGAKNNTVERNTITNSTRGINITNSWNNKIINNNINDTSGSSVIMVNSSSNNISNNRLNYSAYGVAATEKSHNNTIKGNEMENNSVGGVLLLGPSPVQNPSPTVVENNKIRYGDFLGIANQANGTKIIDNEVISEKADGGIGTDRSSGVRIMDNTVKGVKRGVSVFNSSDVKVENNKVLSTKGNGTWIRDANGTEVRDNIIRKSNGSGIWLNNSDKVVLQNNTVTDNNQGTSPSGNAGIYVINSDRLKMTENRIHRNTKYGVSISGSNKSYFANNRVTENCGGTTGFLLSRSSDVVLEGNNVSNNTGQGLMVFNKITNTPPENVTIRDTIVNDNRFLGIGIRAKESKLINVTAKQNSGRNGNIYVEGFGVKIENVETQGGDAGIYLDRANGSKIIDSTIKGSLFGVGLFSSNNTVIRNTTFKGNGDTGLTIVSSTSNTSVEDSKFLNNKVWDIVIGELNASLENISVGSTKIASAEGRNVYFKEETNPAPTPSGKKDIGAFVNATEATNRNGYLDLTVEYTDNDASGVNESTLDFWKYDGSSWTEVKSTVNENANRVSANLSSFSVFAPLGNESGPDIKYSGLSVSKTKVNVSEEVEVTTIVENKGNKAGSYNASLKVDGNIRKYKNGTLSPGSSKTLTFKTSFSSKGKYKVTIDGLSAKTINVTERKVSTIEEAIANLKSQNNIVNFSELQSAISFWIQNKEVPNTGGKKIDFAKLQDLISLWVQEKEV